MPILNPRDHGYKPSDWRQVYDAYSSLTALVHKYKGSTAGWHLNFPSRARKLIDARWQMTFVPMGQKNLTTIWLGINGEDASKAIKKMLPYYRDYYKSQGTVTEKVVKKPSPLSDHSAMYKLAEALRGEQRGTALNEFQSWLANRKAGILEMSMRTYLMRHPHATFYPTPPRSKEEFEGRQKEYLQTIADMEKGRAESKPAFWEEDYQGPGKAPVWPPRQRNVLPPPSPELKE